MGRIARSLAAGVAGSALLAGGAWAKDFPLPPGTFGPQGTTYSALQPPILTTVLRDAIKSPGPGIIIFNTTTNRLEWWNGLAWDGGVTQLGDNAFSGTNTFTNVVILPPPAPSVDASASINAKLVSGTKVQLTCGTYYISKPIVLPSYSELAGAGPCTNIISSNIVASPQWASLGVTAYEMLTNVDFINGNSNVSVHDLSMTFGSSVIGPSSIEFYKTSYASVYNMNISKSGVTTGNDGIAFIQSDHYSVHNNTVSGVTNACYDQWQASHDFDVSHNKCEGGGVLAYGILVNGLGGNWVQNRNLTTYNGMVSFNTINSTRLSGIWVAGLTDGSAVGVVNKISVVSNTITGVSQFHGLNLSDGTEISAVGNIIDSVGARGISACSSSIGTFSQISIKDNIIKDANLASSNSPAIDICGPSTSAVSTANNTISGTTQNYSIWIEPGVTGASVNESNLPTGTANGNSTAAIQDSGTGSTVIHNLGGISYVNGQALNGTGTWTPTLSFGGASTGITYNTQAGQYWQNGPNVRVCAQIALSSKGSSTGGAVIGGLPFRTHATPSAMQVNYLANTIGLTFPAPLVQVPAGGGRALALFTDYSVGTAVNDANFANNTFLQFCGTFATP